VDDELMGRDVHKQSAMWRQGRTMICMSSWKKATVAFLLPCALLVGHVWAEPSYTVMGDVESYEEDGHTVTFNCQNGKVRLSFLEEDLVRVHMAPDGRFPPDDLHLGENGPYAVVTYDWPGVPYEISESSDPGLEGMIYDIRAGKLRVKVTKKPFRLAFHDAGGKSLVREKTGLVDAGLGYADSRVYETMSLPDDEHFFGFGAHNHPLDMRGRELTCYARELENLEENGGFPTPFFLSSRGYGLFFHNLDDDVTFRMGTTPGEYSFEATSGARSGWDMDYYLIYGPGFDRVMKRYIDIVGKPILPAKWYFGHIQLQCCDWTGARVMEVAERYRQGGWPSDVIIMDAQALNEGWVWAGEYDNYEEMYELLDEKGFKTGYSDALWHDIHDWTKFDPTVEDDRKKYWGFHVARVKDGMDFWRQDNSERYYRWSAIDTLANGYEAHELFGSLWAKIIVEGMESMGLYGRAVISRGGPIGGHRYIVPWPGDIAHGLEFLSADLSFIRNGGLTGYAAITVDLGGYQAYEDLGGKDPFEEHNLYRRTIDMIPVVPVSKFQGQGDRSAKLPWLLTPDQQDLMRHYLKLRYRLHPYYYSSAIEAHLTGRPILASLVFDHQGDPETYDKDFHFMLGRQLLVAPVMEKAETWDVYLPHGRWIHYWTGKEYQGGQIVTVNAPRRGEDGLPMFVKAGAIIPMMPEMDYVYEKAPDPITLDVYPDAAGTTGFVMYDSETAKGPFSETRFTCSGDGSKISVSISESDVSYELWVHAAGAPDSVASDGKTLPERADKVAYDEAKEGWYYGPGCFYGSDAMNTVNIKIGRSPKPHHIQIAR
jgi:alpha-glucosidase